METRYQVLRIIGTVYKVLGIIVASVTVLAIIGFCLFSLLGGGLTSLGAADADEAFAGLLGGTLCGIFSTVIFGVIMIIYGGGIALTLYAAGEGIYLLLALEENTRTTARLLQGRSD